MRFRTASTYSRGFQVRAVDAVEIIGDEKLGLATIFRFVSTLFQVSGTELDQCKEGGWEEEAARGGWDEE